MENATNSLNPILASVLGLIAGLLLSAFKTTLTWLNEKKKEKKVKTAELISAISVYLDYMITISWYPIDKLKKVEEDEIIQKLIQLKSDLIKSQTLVAAYDYKKYLFTKKIIKETISKDEKLSELIFTLNTDTKSEQYEKLNTELIDLMKSLHDIVPILMNDKKKILPPTEHSH